MDESSALKVGGVQLSIEMSLFLAACFAALIAVFGRPGSVSGAAFVFAILGLVPWVFVVRGRQLSQLLFVAMTLIPAAVIVIVIGNPGGLFPAMIAVVWITRRSSRAVISTGVVAAIGMTIACALLRPSDFEGEIYFLGGIGVSWLAGMLLRRQAILVDEIREAAERESQHAAIEERARIAREVHDVIAHSLTVTILNVTGARRALTNDPERAAAALERAEAVGRESLDSIRQVVGLLREPTGMPDVCDNNSENPLPQLSDIPTLVSQFRDGGMIVHASIDVDDVEAGAMTSLAAFRLLQEAMTNSLQHAPGAPVTLKIGFERNEPAIRIEVENPIGETPPQSRPGLGLIGMAERVRTAGGSIRIGPTTRDTWLVDANLPIHLVKEPL
jgi:signal transduction histidine kinase